MQVEYNLYNINNSSNCVFLFYSWIIFIFVKGLFLPSVKVKYCRKIGKRRGWWRKGSVEWGIDNQPVDKRLGYQQQVLSNADIRTCSLLPLYSPFFPFMLSVVCPLIDSTPYWVWRFTFSVKCFIFVVQTLKWNSVRILHNWAILFVALKKTEILSLI